MKLTKYPELETVRQTRDVEVAEGVTITVQDLPPTYAATLRARLPEPKPPVLGPAMDGRKVILGDNGRPVMTYDEADPEYQAALSEHSVRSTAFFLTEGIVAGQVEWETRYDPDKGWGEYYDSILREITAIGFGLGQLTRLQEAVTELSEITDEDVEDARRDFSEAGT